MYQIPEDITTRSLAMALLSDARMIQQKKMSFVTEDVTGSWVAPLTNDSVYWRIVSDFIDFLSPEIVFWCFYILI